MEHPIKHLKTELRRIQSEIDLRNIWLKEELIRTDLPKKWMLRQESRRDEVKEEKRVLIRNKQETILAIKSLILVNK